MGALAALKGKSGAGEILVTGEFPLYRQDLETISELIYADAGIFMNDSKASLIYSRLSKRIRQLKLTSFRQYCDLVSSVAGAAERREMLSFLTTNFTKFFRENHHFDHLKSTILPGLIERARNGGRVRIWSAGCSDGSEPYSIALTVLSVFPDASNYDFKILATDIDPKILAKAKAGIYDDNAVETVPAALRKQWFNRLGDGRTGDWQVDDQVKQLITYRELNLMGQWPLKGPFQVIFCRNVVIYFDEPTQAKIWVRYAELLEDQATLFIGHSERLSGSGKDHFESNGITTFRYNQSSTGGRS